ncbi:hypothetical protein CSB93_5294 [Pseudomonas paraeruginosa]|uniref:Uncharacterized protein n=1 Tax=Pseudomonas paraeruginosa TaxID=2994495 RepID=A0A2R3J294_9PSED|nr:hypothetical protein CSB93_5294 [Pseudomonas paraeruginosa]AWE91310.1 hypothetical protein CSC28_4086 [Pseudomonas paraeruginosa]PTC35221.1 hypothetical protein CLJ1_3921 [Pseudomonas aeruginosa]
MRHEAGASPRRGALSCLRARREKPPLSSLPATRDKTRVPASVAGAP